MPHEDVKDFYQVLDIPRDADTAIIEEMLEEFEHKKRLELLDPAMARAALRTMDELIPAIRGALLSGVAHRAAYDQRLVAAEHDRRAQLDSKGDAVKLDEPFIAPFYFDRRNNLDTEKPALTMQKLIEKLEDDWQQTRDWLFDSAQSNHPLLLFIKYQSSPRPSARNTLADRLNTELFQNIVTMHRDEAVERCLSLLHPHIEHPTLTINDVSDAQSQTFYLGEVIPGAASPSSITIAHTGKRGCLFGTVESTTEWLTLPDHQIRQRFALLAAKIATPDSPSLLSLPLFFDFRQLARNTVHKATLVFHVENYEPPCDIPIQIALKVLPVPPRVTFEPLLPSKVSLSLTATRRGIPASLILIPRNAGDEQLLPLAARLYSTEPGVRYDQPLIRANIPVTISVDTRERLSGSQYSITVNVDYSPTPGAQGIQELTIYGEILPTPWQSMVLEKSSMQRNQAGLAGALVGLIAGGIAGAFAINLFVLWLILLPILFIWLVHLSTMTIITHQRVAGDTRISLKQVSPFVRWIAPAMIAILLAVLFQILANTPSIIIGAGIGTLVGYTVCFIADQKPKNTVMQPAMVEQQHRLRNT